MCASFPSTFFMGILSGQRFDLELYQSLTRLGYSGEVTQGILKDTAGQELFIKKSVEGKWNQDVCPTLGLSAKQVFYQISKRSN